MSLSSTKFRRKVSPPTPSIILVQSPTEPIKNGKNRRKFPSSRDCCVRIEVSHAGNERVRYESDGRSNVASTVGATYFLGVSSITRHVTRKQLTDLPLHMVCQHQPLNTLKNNEPGRYGFWFRFFGKSCRFHIIITLKIHCRGQVDKLVNSIELDIRNIENVSKNRNISRTPSNNKSYFSSLYFDKEYIRIMEKLQNLQENCMWEKCISVSEELLRLEEDKSDFRVCILLEQSKVLCHVGDFVAAKLLVKQALGAIPKKSKNKSLLVARGYTYLSLCHHYDCALGNAEECLRIACEMLVDFQPCLDTADLHYNQGRLLLSFLLRIPNFSKGLIDEARANLKKSIDHFQELHNSNHVTVLNRIYNAQLYLAVLMLVVGQDIGSNGETIVSTMPDVPMSLETKCRLSFVKALVLQRELACETAIANAKHALQLAKTCGLCIEERLIVKYFNSLKNM